MTKTARRAERLTVPLQRVLLTVTWQNLATTPIGQPVEAPGVRPLLTDPVTGRFAQMVLRVGYGRTAGAAPRRPLAEVLAANPGPGGAL